MTPEERRKAAEVMSTEGPWEWRWRGSQQWNACEGEPEWNWAEKEYRVRELAPCPFCGSRKVDLRKESNSVIYITCTNLACCAHGPLELSVNQACISWNVRATPEEQ